MQPLLALVLLTALGLPAPAQDGPRRSLQDLLAEQRAAAEAAREAVRPAVEDLVGKLRNAVNTRENLGVEVTAIPELRAELVALGPAIGPLLLTAINPPDKSNDATVALASEVVNVLASLPLVPIQSELEVMAVEGNRIGRRSALDLLGQTPRRDRALPILLAAYANDAPNRPTALRSICLQGGVEAEALLTELLEGAARIGKAKDEPVALLTAALETMAARGAAGVPVEAGQVLFLKRLIHSPSLENLARPALQLTPHVPEGELTESETLAFATLAARSTLPRDLRTDVLDALPTSGLPFSDELEDKFEDLVEGTSPLMAEAALICLARYGDKKAKTRLLKPYRDDVNKDRNDPAALQARGTILMRLGDYHDATVDLKRAIKIIVSDKDRSPFLANSATITLARTYCLMGELKDAYKTLKESVLATNELRKLADDPDFAPLVADEKYKPVFRL